MWNMRAEPIMLLAMGVSFFGLSTQIKPGANQVAQKRAFNIFTIVLVITAVILMAL